MWRVLRGINNCFATVLLRRRGGSPGTPTCRLSGAPPALRLFNWRTMPAREKTWSSASGGGLTRQGGGGDGCGIVYGMAKNNIFFIAVLGYRVAII